MKKQTSGFTFVELMITVVIFISITLLGVFTIQSYLPKHRLLDSLETVEQSLSRAQLEATSRSTWTCVSYDSTARTVNVFVDVNANHATSVTGCGDGTDLRITSQELRTGVSFVPEGNTGCTGTGSYGLEKTFLFATPLWFNSSGVPNGCVVGNCAPTSVPIILANSFLPSGNRAREIEVISSGLINIVNRNEKGYLDAVYAKSAQLPNGCE